MEDYYPYGVHPSLHQSLSIYKRVPAESVFLDALASLDFKMSVSQWVRDVFQLAHLRVFQSYFFTKFFVSILLNTKVSSL